MPFCKVCGATEKDADFYKSIKTYCKSHWKERVRTNRKCRASQYSDYERARSHLSHRVALRGAVNPLFCRLPKDHPSRCSSDLAEYYRNPKDFLKRSQNYKRSNPNKYKAHYTVSNAVSTGKMKKDVLCQYCGNYDKLQGHHCDYGKLLDVQWLCIHCHKQWHRDNGSALNP